MANTIRDFEEHDNTLEQKKAIGQLFFRIIPYTPWVILALMIGLFCSKLYLRYATKLYAAKARLIVNDDSQQKSTNMLEAMQLQYKDISAETERELEILRSRDLLSNLVKKLQLNVSYSQKGYIKSGQYFTNLPFTLELEQPDSVLIRFTGQAEIVGDAVRFDKVIFPADSFVSSKWGNIRWHINRGYKPADAAKDDWFLTLRPISAAVGSLKRALKIEPISKQSSILELTYTDELPQRGILILDSLISMYGISTVTYKSRISAYTLNFLDDRLRLISEELGGVEKKLQDYKTKENIVDLGTEGNLFLTQIKEADAKIGELDVKLDVLNQIEGYVNKRNNSTNPVPATLGTVDPVLTELLNQLYQTEFELEKTKQISGIKNPQIEVYETMIAKLKPSIISSINNLKVDIATSRRQLQEQNSKLSGTLTKIPLKERLLIDISRQQGIKNAIYTFLLQKREESDISAASIVPNYRVIEKPEDAGLVSPEGSKINVIGLLSAFMLSCLFIYFREFFNNRLLFRAQIESKVSAPIIAELSYQPSETGTPIVVGMGSRNLIGEQFRELRTNLNYVTAVTQEKSKVILITSSISGEGKSFVSINTAVSLSITGARVVLLEFDLRKPKISKELGIAREPGLSNYLISMAAEKDVIKAHPSIENFSIIPSGQIPPNPAELISSPRLSELMTYLKQHFDYIIIDSPPVGAVTDAKILAGVADVTLYLVRYDYTHSNLLQVINDVHQKNILPNLNIIFNGIIPKKILGYSYGKGYEYGYNYGYGYGYVENKGGKTSLFKRIFGK
jgi:capsular exopolysaccharide synthesis family protein